MEVGMAGSGRSSSLGRKRRCSSRYIPEEIVEQILARLPVKSLLRFESACKTWYSLIRSQHFINLHHCYHPRQHHNLLLCNYKSASKSYAISSVTPSSSPPPPFHLRRFSDAKLPKTLFEFRVPETLTLGRCHWDGGSLMEFPCLRMIGPSEHGIYCFISDLFPMVIRAFGSKSRINNLTASTVGSANIALANLATRSIHVILPFPFESAALQCFKASWHYKAEFGFGCIQNNEYKVVAIVQIRREFKSIAFVYSSKRASWNQMCDFNYGSRRRLLGDLNKRALAGLVNEQSGVRFPEILHDHDPLHKRMVRHSNCFFLNGSCHWVASVLREQREEYCILVFDMRSEVFLSMLGPPSGDEHGGYLRRHIFVVKDHIGMALMHRGGVDLRMMMVYGDEESWVEFGRCTCEFGCSLPSLVGLSLGSDDSDDRLYLEGHDAALFDASFRLNDEINFDDQRPSLYSFAMGFQSPNLEALGHFLPVR